MSELSPSEQLRNICAALSEQADESPFSREEWERIDAENVALKKRLSDDEGLFNYALERERKLQAALAEAERRSNIWQYAWQWDVDVRSHDGGYYAIRQWPDEDDIRGPVRSSVDEAIEGLMGMDGGNAVSASGVQK